MTSPSNFPKKRSAFTLVELLVVISVIGVLVGMLMVGLGPVMTRVNQAAIQTEMEQLKGSIEHFKNDYNFYPPSFESLEPTNATANGPGSASSIAASQAFARYLNKIAPSHGYAVLIGGSPNVPSIEGWWQAVGKEIRQTDGADLVFWLSGLAKNKQFPLHYNDPSTGRPVYLSGHPFSTDANDANVERDVRFDFQNKRLVFTDPDSNGRAACTYSQTKGPARPFLYFSSQGGYFNGYFVGSNYYNTDSFQLIAAGRDGDFGALETTLPSTGADVSLMGSPAISPGAIAIGNAGQKGNDNLSNFSGGILERAILGTN